MPKPKWPAASAAVSVSEVEDPEPAEAIERVTDTSENGEAAAVRHPTGVTEKTTGTSEVTEPDEHQPTDSTGRTTRTSDDGASDSRHPTDAQLWRSVEHTVRTVLLPAIDDDWARAAAIQLVGLARYAQARGGGGRTGRVGELLAVLDLLKTNPLVTAQWRGEADEAEVHRATGAILAAAISPDADPAAAAEVRSLLRPVVMRQLDDELKVTSILIPYFRGEIDA